MAGDIRMDAQRIWVSLNGRTDAQPTSFCQRARACAHPNNPASSLLAVTRLFVSLDSLPSTSPLLHSMFGNKIPYEERVLVLLAFVLSSLVLVYVYVTPAS